MKFNAAVVVQGWEDTKSFEIESYASDRLLADRLNLTSPSDYWNKSNVIVATLIRLRREKPYMFFPGILIGDSISYILALT